MELKTARKDLEVRGNASRDAKQGKKFGSGFFAALGEIGKNVLEFMAEHKLLTAWLAASVAGFAVSAPGLGDSIAALLAAMGTGVSAIISAAATAFAIDKNGDGFYTDGEFKAVLAACIAAVLLNAGGCGLVIKDVRDTNIAFEQQVNAAKAEILSQGTFSQEELDMADKLDLDELLITMAERPEEFASKLAAMREKILTSNGVMTPKNISQLRMLLILNGEAEEDLDYNKIFKLFEEKER